MREVKASFSLADFLPKSIKVLLKKKHFFGKLTLKKRYEKIASHSETMSFSITLPCFIGKTNVRKNSIDQIGNTEEIITKVLSESKSFCHEKGAF